MWAQFLRARVGRCVSLRLFSVRRIYGKGGCETYVAWSLLVHKCSGGAALSRHQYELGKPWCEGGVDGEN